MHEHPVSDLAHAFGLVDIAEESLSPWSPVYRARVIPRGHTEARDVVVKKTAEARERAEGMAVWTRMLMANGFPVVAPIGLDVPNPQAIGEDWYVVYPFIEGRPYAAGDDVAALGDLLGRLHATQVRTGIVGGLRTYSWPEATRDDVDADLAAFREQLPRVLGAEDAAKSLAALHSLADRWWDHSLPALRAADDEHALPYASVTSDYKAANVIFSASGPTVVDPDNGGWEPRLFDLAMAVVLLHNESPSAPARMMTAQEWNDFYSSYARHISLTSTERKLWPAALDHMAWEEGTWALEDNEDAAYADARQGGYLRDLATMPMERFQLPAA